MEPRRQTGPGGSGRRCACRSSSANAFLSCARPTPMQGTSAVALRAPIYAAPCASTSCFYLRWPFPRVPLLFSRHAVTSLRRRIYADLEYGRAARGSYSRCIFATAACSAHAVLTSRTRVSDRRSRRRKLVHFAYTGDAPHVTAQGMRGRGHDIQGSVVPRQVREKTWQRLLRLSGGNGCLLRARRHESGEGRCWQRRARRCWRERC
jgi:hypothetical protein